MILQIVLKKLILWPLEWRQKFDSLGFFVFFLNQKMRKNYDNILLNFQQKKYVQKLIFIYFYTKMTIYPVTWGTFRPITFI